MPRGPSGKRKVTADGIVTVHGRTGNGEGSVYFETSRGSWRATYRLPGDLRMHVVRAKTRAEAVERRDLAIATYQPPAGSVSAFSARTTVAELAAWWLNTEARQSVRASSFGTISNRLTPSRLRGLADVPVVELRSEQVMTWKSELLDRLAPSTVADTRATLKQVLDQAVDHGLIVRNPVDKVKPPTVVENKQRRVLTRDQVAQLIVACDVSRYAAAVAIMYTTGLRVSEALGLAWEDIDLDEGTAHVRRAVIEVKGQGKLLGPPKTNGAKGVHFLAPGAVERLRARKAVQDEERERAGLMWKTIVYEKSVVSLVFTAEDGSIGSRQRIDQLVRRKAEALGIDTVGLGTHVGRRTVIDTLRNAGVPLDDIAHHVGHANTSTTAGYVQGMGQRPQQTARRAAELLDPTVA
jgi:integrase